MLKILLPLILLADLWSFGWKYLRTVEPEAYSWPPQLVEFLKKEKEPFRIISVDDPSSLNRGMIYGVSEVGGNDPSTLRQYSEYINLNEGRSPDIPVVYMQIAKYSELINLLNLKYIIFHHGGGLKYDILRPVLSLNQMTVYENQLFIPRAFMVHKAEVIRGREAIFQRLGSKDFNPRQYVILEEMLPGRLPDDPLPFNPKEAKIPHYGPHRILVKTNSPQEGLLILSDAYYPGWKVKVDGREGKIYRADHIVRGVYLDKGKHRVEFTYEPFSFKLGWCISLLSLLAIITYAVITSKKQDLTP